MPKRCPKDGSLWCGKCYVNVTEGSTHKGHYGYHKPRPVTKLKGWEVAVMKKKEREDAFSRGGLPPRGDCLSQLDTLFSYLTDDLWDDHTERQRATMMMFADGPTWKVWFNDRALGRSCWMTGETIEGALIALDQGLADDSVSWKTEGKKPVKGR